MLWYTASICWPVLYNTCVYNASVFCLIKYNLSPSLHVTFSMQNEMALFKDHQHSKLRNPDSCWHYRLVLVVPDSWRCIRRPNQIDLVGDCKSDPSSRLYSANHNTSCHRYLGRSIGESLPLQEQGIQKRRKGHVSSTEFGQTKTDLISNMRVSTY